MPIRNGQAFFAGSRLLTFPAGTDEQTPNCIGLYVETGGYVKVTTYGGDTDEFLVQDGSYLPGMIVTVFAVPARGTAATGIHALT